jgi:septal ring factor EnvC (AmiA/AmiB activator)
LSSTAEPLINAPLWQRGKDGCLPNVPRTAMLKTIMKNVIGVVILAVVSIGLVVALVVTKKTATREKHQDTEKILFFSNDLVKTSGTLDEQRQVNFTLEKDLESRKQQFGELTNKYAEVAAKYNETTSTLARTEQTLKSTLDEMAKRDAKISELEAQNQSYEQKAIDLSVALTNLTIQIADTQKKLTASEGDKAFLEKELKRLMGEKAELERQFNDLTVLRAQVAKLKEELSIARRLDWIRKGLFSSADLKGAQLLVQRGPGALVAPETKTNQYELNVEVGTDGAVRVIPPLTNRPPETPPAPKQ